MGGGDFKKSVGLSSNEIESISEEQAKINKLVTDGLVGLFNRPQGYDYDQNIKAVVDKLRDRVKFSGSELMDGTRDVVGLNNSVLGKRLTDFISLYALDPLFADNKHAYLLGMKVEEVESPTPQKSEPNAKPQVQVAPFAEQNNVGEFIKKFRGDLKLYAERGFSPNNTRQELTAGLGKLLYARIVEANTLIRVLEEYRNTHPSDATSINNAIKDVKAVIIDAGKLLDKSFEDEITGVSEFQLNNAQKEAAESLVALDKQVQVVNKLNVGTTTNIQDRLISVQNQRNNTKEIGQLNTVITNTKKIIKKLEENHAKLVNRLEVLSKQESSPEIVARMQELQTLIGKSKEVMDSKIKELQQLESNVQASVANAKQQNEYAKVFEENKQNSMINVKLQGDVPVAEYVNIDQRINDLENALAASTDPEIPYGALVEINNIKTILKNEIISLNTEQSLKSKTLEELTANNTRVSELLQKIKTTEELQSNYGEKVQTQNKNESQSAPKPQGISTQPDYLANIAVKQVGHYADQLSEKHPNTTPVTEKPDYLTAVAGLRDINTRINGPEKQDGIYSLNSPLMYNFTAQYSDGKGHEHVKNDLQKLNNIHGALLAQAQSLKEKALQNPVQARELMGKLDVINAQLAQVIELKKKPLELIAKYEGLVNEQQNANLAKENKQTAAKQAIEDLVTRSVNNYLSKDHTISDERAVLLVALQIVADPKTPLIDKFMYLNMVLEALENEPTSRWSSKKELRDTVRAILKDTAIKQAVADMPTAHESKTGTLLKNLIIECAPLHDAGARKAKLAEPAGKLNVITQINKWKPKLFAKWEIEAHTATASHGKYMKTDLSAVEKVKNPEKDYKHHILKK